MTMDLLPLELQTAICGFLSNSRESDHRLNVGNFRLTSRSFAFAGEGFVLRQVHVEYNRQSSQRLLESAQHPKFGKHINAILLNSCHQDKNLRSYETWIYWYDMLSQRVSNDDTNECIRKLLTNDHNLPRFSLLSDSELDSVSNEIERIFATEMKDMWRACCDSIDFQTDNPIADLLEQRLPPIYDICPKLETVIIDENSTCACCNNKIHEYRYDHTSHDPCNSSTALLGFCKAAAGTGTKLRTILCTRMNRGLFDMPKSGKDVQPALEHLQSLWLKVSGSRKTTTKRITEPAFCAALASATHLGEIRIVVRESCELEQESLVLSSIVGNSVWPSLQRVHLHGIKSEEQDLTDFVLRHKSTLQTLVIIDVQLVGDWDTFFSAIAGKLPELRGTRFGGNLTATRRQGLNADITTPETLDYDYRFRHVRRTAMPSFLHAYLITGSELGPSFFDYACAVRAIQSASRLGDGGVHEPLPSYPTYAARVNDCRGWRSDQYSGLHPFR